MGINYKKITLAIVVIFVVGGSAVLAVWWYQANSQSINNITETVAPGEGIVLASASCGCCTNYVDYLNNEGTLARKVPTEDMNSVKKKYGIPITMQSCHTMLIDGYVIEGHVPLEAINKLLTEKPEGVVGLALPDMPAGSPGMGGNQYGDLVIYALYDHKDPEVYLTL